ncbi:hypothetical protein HPP92_001878 [Vanilla planifolia]|uniref:Uncharacterized protein n=1 Tax=Vanilla planifolia TaxID=51239 RepID=A0A835VM85_VANPL|nr:hypothetical protein HPP92_001878 [Vanilla planifolia]
MESIFRGLAVYLIILVEKNWQKPLYSVTFFSKFQSLLHSAEFCIFLNAEECFNKVVNLFLENGRLNMTAKDTARLSASLGSFLCLLHSNISILFEEVFYSFHLLHDIGISRAADLFENEEVTSSANQYKKKVAHLAAQLEQYPKAIEIFEETARQSVHSNLLRHSVKGILLNSEICELLNPSNQIQEIDPAFAGTHEHKLLTDLAAAVDEEDVEKFTGSIKDFDGITRLDPWKTALLLRAKNKLHEKKKRGR